MDGYMEWQVYLNADNIIPNDILRDMLHDGFDSTEYWEMRQSQASDAKWYMVGAISLIILSVLILGGIGVVLG